MLFTKVIAALFLAASAAAAPFAREACAYQCSDVCYFQRTIDAAVAKGYSLHEEGKTIPDNYPHQYNNREGFDFETEGPWYEFPIMRGFNVYAGGSPGADRVIFNEQGEFTAVITHSGEDNNNFGACSI
ncbi:extracellular guanyl-specific ribonuclease [Trichosporon asahii var. asahii CBS 2479]|uniref:Extracellular guanyl-specific ribonuclease n=1 Tax=Trichosporon asahii var. asahii (strain ATCC 90039 / CBS 2479 / JCM 2466 / KCTC 7840 / NBRC 103889/ NCYC 2677 / UAMH 7654) TaxID=1186058 RepID=J6F554_TRIAS|nr:extracellular guanyl-specific ribonuclease [Trichosporon asahii var. asahii CBS 2479]EJT50417.1 extracellular guanyl-specific ribonuclease [Trichosporon asahii var. asahii CBS 2479]